MEERNMIKEKNKYKKWEKKNLFHEDWHMQQLKIFCKIEKGKFRLVKFYTDYQTIDGIELTL